jgi:hypothetical protein
LLGLQADDDDGNLASNKKINNSVNSQQEKKDDKEWLQQWQLDAVLKSTKEEAQRIIKQYKINKEYREKINKQFNLK